MIQKDNFVEQIEAMRIIDKICAEKKNKDFILNYPALKKEMFQKIKEYYEANDVDVTDDIINAGVDEWFKEKYLKKEEPKKISKLVLFFSFLYVNRKSFALSVLAVFVVSLLFCVGENYFAENKRKELLVITDKLNGSTLDSYKEKFEKLKEVPTKYISEQFKTELENGIQLNIERFYSLVHSKKEMNLDESTLNSASRPKLKEINEKLQNSNFIKNYSNILNRLDIEITQFSNLINVDKTLTDLGIDEIQNTTIQTKFVSLVSLLNSRTIFSTMGNKQFQDDFDALKVDIELYNKLKMIGNIITEKKDYFKKLSLTKTEKEIIDSLITKTDLSIKELDKDDLESNLRMLDYYYNLSKIKLTLKIVDQAGANSGIIRYYNGNKSIKNHYIIVQPVDMNNKIYPIYVTSVESGYTSQTSKMGIKVSEKKYDAVKADKLDDGTIDDRYIGTKEVGHIKFNYVDNVYDAFITKW